MSSKSFIIDELDNHLKELRIQRASERRDNIRVAVKEEQEAAEAAVQAATRQLQREGVYMLAQQAAEKAFAEKEQYMFQRSYAPEVDEFGRDANMERQAQWETRKARRQKQVKQEQHALARVHDGYVVMAADDSGGEGGDDEQGHYLAKKSELYKEATTVFSDAAQEFSSLEEVKETLERWKFDYPQAYQQAYMPLSVPALFAPFVRLQLLHWDPLYTTTDDPVQSFSNLEWHNLLFSYGIKEEMQSQTTDEDFNLVPDLVRKLVLPLAEHMSECWDPWSLAQSRGIRTMLDDLLIYLNVQEEENLQKLLTSAKDTLSTAVQEATLPKWQLRTVQASPRVWAVLSSRFRSICRLLGSVCVFDGLLARTVLQHLALSRLLQQQLVPYLRGTLVDPQQALHSVWRVAQYLPAVWFEQNTPLDAKDFLALASEVIQQIWDDKSLRGKGDTQAAITDVVQKLRIRDKVKVSFQMK